MYIDKFLKTHRTPVLDAEDVAAIDASAARTTTFNARQIFIRQHTPLSQCTLLLDGFVERFKDTPDGRRQILAIHVPGDFVDLHSYPLKRLEHSVAALTDIKVALFPHAGIRELTARSATITELLWKSTMIDAAINREWIVSIGARGAAVRLAADAGGSGRCDRTHRRPRQPHVAAVARGRAGDVPSGGGRDRRLGPPARVRRIRPLLSVPRLTPARHRGR
jgi:CRP-like cAMP-binding protein